MRYSQGRTLEVAESGQSHVWDACHKLSIFSWIPASSWRPARTRFPWKCHCGSEVWVTCRRAPSRWWPLLQERSVLDLQLTRGAAYS